MKFLRQGKRFRRRGRRFAFTKCPECCGGGDCPCCTDIAAQTRGVVELVCPCESPAECGFDRLTADAHCCYERTAFLRHHIRVEVYGTHFDEAEFRWVEYFARLITVDGTANRDGSDLRIRDIQYRFDGSVLSDYEAHETESPWYPGCDPIHGTSPILYEPYSGGGLASWRDAIEGVPGVPYLPVGQYAIDCNGAWVASTVSDEGCGQEWPPAARYIFDLRNEVVTKCNGETPPKPDTIAAGGSFVGIGEGGYL